MIKYLKAVIYIAAIFEPQVWLKDPQKALGVKSWTTINNVWQVCIFYIVSAPKQIDRMRRAHKWDYSSFLGQLFSF